MTNPEEWEADNRTIDERLDEVKKQAEEDKKK